MIERPESVIRKVSIGLEYKTAMTYMANQAVMGGEYRIALIQKEEISGNIVIYIINDKKEVLLWKEFTQQVPVSIEYVVDYEGNK